MSGRIIMEPDQIKSDNSMLIINALDNELETLILWLKTVEFDPDIHLYHALLPQPDWAVEVANMVNIILLSTRYKDLLDSSILEMLSLQKSKIIDFGPGSEYTDLLQYFLKSNV